MLARACEIDVKTRELKDLKAQIADYQSRLPNELLKDSKKTLEQKKQKASIREIRLITSIMKSTIRELNYNWLISFKLIL